MLIICYKSLKEPSSTAESHCPICTSFPVMPCRQTVSVATAQEVARNGWKSVTQQTEEVFMLFDFVNHYTVVAKLYTTRAPLYVQF